MLNAQEVTTKWLNSMQRAGDNYRQGVMAVQEAPTARAAAAVDRFVQGVQRAVDDGTWQRGLNRVSLQQWQRSAVDKGATRIATGALAAKDKMQAAMADLLPYIQSGVAQLPPRGDLAANINRSVQMMQHMAAYRRMR